MKKKKKKKESNGLYRFTMFSMCFILCGLLYNINVKKPFLTMNTIKQFKLSDITKVIGWQNLFKEDSAVSSKVNYQLLKDHYYSNGSNEVNAILDGVVLSVKDKEIQLLCDNGVNVLYKNLSSVSIKKDERVLEGTSLGVMDESVQLYFYLNDKEITMQEALSLK